VARKIQAICAGQALSQDNLRRALLPLATDTARETLSVTPKTDVHTPAEWLEIVRKRDQLMWQATRAYIESAVSNAENTLLIEGDLWSDYVADLKVEYRIAFLVDTSPSHADRIIAIARSHTDHNWMSNWTDEQLRTWAAYNIERSRLTKKLANEYGHRVFDVADGGLTQAQALALEYLAPHDL